MKIKKYFLLMLFFSIFCTFNVNALSPRVGEYLSKDGHKIVVNEDNTIKYDDSYALTLANNVKGSTLTGKLGTDKKSATFYQINESNFISNVVVSYKISSTETVNLYDYTVFTMSSTPVVDESGKIELWRDDTKVNTYSTLQSAVDAATNGDVIKITSDLDIGSGAYINGKSITIDGLNHTFKVSTWLNTIFVVEDNASLVVKNLKFEGESLGFEPDFASVDLSTKANYRIPIKTGSDSSDIKRNTSVIITKGNLTLSNSQINNCYTSNSGGAINVVSGNLTLNNSIFNHNRASKGGALYIGRNFKSGETTYPVKNVIINNSEITSNFSYGNGGGMMLFNTESLEINNSKFNYNTGDQASGGAIVIERQTVTGYHSMAEKLGLGYVDIKIDSSIFDGNWVGIENTDGKLVVSNTIFTNNYGVHLSSSCGTVSIVTGREKDENYVTFTNCLFEKNYGSASAFADHNSDNLYVEFIDTDFKDNIASYNTILFYGSNTKFINCNFSGENSGRTVVEIRSYTDSSLVAERNILMKDVTFEDNYKNIPDILIMKNATQNNLYKVTLEGNVKARINLWDKNNLIVKGNLDGYIITDDVITEDDIIMEEGSSINGNITYNFDKKLITLRYPLPSVFFNYYKYIFTDKEVLTKKEFYLEHEISLDGYVMELFTDSTYTTPWDYTLNDDITIYGKWVEHTHTYDNTLVKHGNAIYEQCDCGYLGKKLSLDEPNNTGYTGEGISVVVNNEIGVSSDDYSISYYKEEDGNWVQLNGLPINEGNYKAVLNYNNEDIELIYSIVPEIPNTIDNVGKTIILIIVSIFSLFGIGVLLKKVSN